MTAVSYQNLTEEELNLLAAMAPKSDQINADDLIGGALTLRIESVRIRKPTGQKGDQPVDVYLEGRDKPWRPCKSMMRVLVDKWGGNAAKWVGRWLTLYRDPTVKFGGDQVGGIRISHMSHIETASTIALTVTRGQRSPYTVRPLKVPEAAPTPNNDTRPPLELEKLQGWLAAAVKDQGWTRDGIAALLRNHGSPDGTAANLPPEKRREVVAIVKKPPVVDSPPVADEEPPPPDDPE
jgi:hypothetical protein